MDEYTKIADLTMDEETRARYEKWKRNRIKKRVILPGIGVLCVIILIFVIVLRSPEGVEGTEVVESIESFENTEGNIEELYVSKSIKLESQSESEYILYEETPIVYLFNAHPRELIGSTYDNQFVGEMNIVEVTQILADQLESYGISTLLEDRCVDAKLSNNNWGFYMSYYAARYFVLDAIDRYSSLEFFIDIHRDGVNHEHATVVIDGVSYAQILFVIGTDNPKGYDASDEVARELHDMLEERKPGISRGIFYSGGPGRDGVYSQDISPMVQLIELGTITSTIEEVYHTIEILAEVLAEYVLSLHEDETPYPEELSEEAEVYILMKDSKSLQEY